MSSQSVVGLALKVRIIKKVDVPGEPCNYGYTGLSGVNYKTEYHTGYWDENDYFLITTFYYRPYPYVRAVGTIAGVGSGTFTASFQNVGWPNSVKQHYPNPPNGSAALTGKVEIGYDSGILFGDWFTAEYGGAPCNDSWYINNTPPVSVTITPTPPVVEGTTVTIAWASNNASSCTYNGGISLPNTNGSAAVVASFDNDIEYTVTCLGPLGEYEYGPVGTPGSASATLEVLPGPCGILNHPAFDPVVYAEMMSWTSSEPWERGASLTCVNGAKTVTQKRDSFGTIWPGYTSNDPCSLSFADGSTIVTAMHSHPYFTSSTQYRRGNGCLNDNQSSPSLQQLQALNNVNANFSTNDPNWYNATGKSLYLKTPTGSMVKRLNNSFSSLAGIQVFP